MRKIKRIIVHSTATPEGREVSVADIEAWHKARNFVTIGYHYVVLLDGTTVKGRSLAMEGAHAAGHNKDSIGVVYVGGTDAKLKPKDTRTFAQKESLIKLLKEKVIEYPEAEIIGHCDVAKTSCPSFDAKTEYKII